jgi:pilus assembly protein CpaE
MFQSLTHLLSELTPGSPFVDLKTYPSRRALADCFVGAPPNLCFLDVASDREQALALLGELGNVQPGLPIVAVHVSNDPDLILRCLRQGAKEFLFPPFTAEQVVAALERLSKFAAGALPNKQNTGRVICVMPGKGASGASTMACGLAYQLQRISSDKKVLLADLDPTTGTISFQLKLRSPYSFVDVLSNASQLDESIWKAIVTTCGNVDVLLSPDTPVEGIGDTNEAVNLVNFARELYGYIVIDSKGPYGEWGVTLARAADDLILVTTNELPMLHATQRAIAYLERSGVDRAKIRLVVNRHNADAGLGREAIEMALHLDVYDVLPNDFDAVQKALLEGKPVASGSALGKGLATLASRITGGKQQAAKGKSLFSGIMSLFESKA